MQVTSGRALAKACAFARVSAPTRKGPQPRQHPWAGGSAARSDTSDAARRGITQSVSERPGCIRFARKNGLGSAGVNDSREFRDFGELVDFLVGWGSWSDEAVYDIVGMAHLLGACLDNLRARSLQSDPEALATALTPGQRETLMALAERISIAARDLQARPSTTDC